MKIFTQCFKQPQRVGQNRCAGETLKGRNTRGQEAVKVVRSNIEGYHQRNGIWEEHIKKFTLGCVYSIYPVTFHVCNNTKKLATTNTSIERVHDFEELKKIEIKTMRLHIETIKEISTIQHKVPNAQRSRELRSS